MVSQGHLFRYHWRATKGLHSTVSGVRCRPASKAAIRSQVFNVFRGAFAPVPMGIYYPTTMVLSPPHFSPPIPSSLSTLPIVLTSLSFHPILGEATPFNRLGKLGELCKLPVGSGADIDFGVFWEGKTHLTAIIIWIFVCRKIHTYVFYKTHIDNIAVWVVLPLVIWLMHVLSACELRRYLLSQ